MEDTDDPIKILGLTQDSSPEDVRERYRVLCLKYHPDKHPGNEDLFQRVTEAYTKIKSNPGILKKQRVTGPVSYLEGDIILTIEDFYFAKEKSVSFTRTGLCPKCFGTGAKGGRGAVCACCGGQGIMDSPLLSLLGRDAICPVCKGSGITGDPCPACGGEKRVKEKVTARFRATLYVYYNKHILLKGMGNARQDGSYEDLMVRVQVHQDPYIKVESNYFVVAVNVTPVQTAVGDRGILDIFGRKVPYVIKKGEKEAEALDGIRSNFSRTIRIRFKTYIPESTPETADLYDRIKEMESKSCEKVGEKIPISSITDFEQASQPRL
jgi:molecular chaperone DnaJ